MGAEPRGYGGRRAIVLSMGREDEVFQAKWNKRLRTWIPVGCVGPGARCARIGCVR